MSFRHEGSGPLVTFLHGFSLDHRMWRPQVEALRDRCATLALDLPGFGEGGRGLHGELCATEAVAAALDQVGARETHLVGFSFGGAVAIDFALANPERLRSLTLINALLLGRPTQRPGWRRYMELARGGDVAGALEAWLLDETFAGLHSGPHFPFVAEVVRAYSGKHWSGEVTNRFRVDDPGAKLGDIAVPTLVIGGDRDTLGFQAMAAELADKIPGARRETLPGVGHMATFEAAEQINRLLREHVETIEAARQRGA